MFGIYDCSIAGVGAWPDGAFLASLLGSLLCKARLNVYPVPSATKTMLQEWLSLQQ